MPELERLAKVRRDAFFVWKDGVDPWSARADKNAFIAATDAYWAATKAQLTPAEMAIVTEACAEAVAWLECLAQKYPARRPCEALGDGPETAS